MYVVMTKCEIIRVRSAHLSPFTHWVNPGKPGLGFKPYFGKSGEYWVLKYFKCSDLCKFADIEASKTS